MSPRVEPTFRTNNRIQPEDSNTRTQSGATTFEGTASEYFGIWIVNIILSIITIGIYSAWAKVKRETYFKSNTYIGRYDFGYHATGFQILKGRLIAFLVLIVINIIATFFPLIGPVIFIAFIFLIPLIINNSMRFTARMTSYRNVRFNWSGTYWQSFWFFMIAPIISIVSLGILMPLISKSHYAYFARSHSYGTSQFSCEPSAKDYYIAFGVGVILPVLIILTTIFATVAAWNLELSNISNLNISDAISNDFAQFIPLAIILAFALATSVYKTLCRNLMMKSLKLSDVATFDSSINPIRYLWIRITNIIAAVFTLGLLLPWGQVRAHKYLCECSNFTITGDIDKFIDEATNTKSSFGEEFAELEGFEVTI